MKKKLKISFVGDVITPPFNKLDQFIDLDLDLNLDFYHHNIDQVFQALMQPVDCDILIIHLSSDFFFEEMSEEETIKKVDQYCDAVNHFAKNESTILIINLIAFVKDRVIGFDYFKSINLYSSINSKIIDLATNNLNISLIDMQRIISETGLSKFFNLQNKLMMRMPYTKSALENILAHYSLAIEERFNIRKKVLIIDADNTLWGGVVGEDGVEGVSINKDYPGIIFRKFQRQLLEIHNTGILLVMVTKNNIQEIDEMFDYHDMPLKREHFIKVIANWEPKSINISKVSKELNLDSDSFIFIDDNEFELEEVRSSLPEIQSFRFDSRFPEKSLNIINNVKGFKTWSLSIEDKTKTIQYQDQKKRETHRSNIKNVDEYLLSLEMNLEIGINRSSQIKRISNLTNKTNQFNLTTRRYSEIDITNFMEKDCVVDFGLKDNFGDMGIIGVAIVKDNFIDTFLISCRAFGRKIEVEILEYICVKFKQNNIESMYIPSKKNDIAKNFYDSNGFKLIENKKNGTKKYKIGAGPTKTKFFNIKEAS